MVAVLLRVVLLREGTYRGVCDNERWCGGYRVYEISGQVGLSNRYRVRRIIGQMCGG